MANFGDRSVREQLVNTLRGGNAFESFEKIVSEVPPSGRFVVPEGKGRSAWQIVDHMRRALEDLTGFIDNYDGAYKELDWPGDYWPKDPAPSDSEGWDQSIEGFHIARKRIEELIMDPSRELTAVFPWSEGQTLLHEALLAIEHTAYHLGELVELTVVLADH